LESTFYYTNYKIASTARIAVGVAGIPNWIKEELQIYMIWTLAFSSNGLSVDVTAACS
jgi:hypothetical protein